MTPTLPIGNARSVNWTSARSVYWSSNEGIKSIPALNVLNVTLEDEHSIKILVASPKGSNKLRVKTIELVAADAEKAKEWVPLVNRAAYKDSKRGKRFKVIINPFSGTGKASETFHKEVKPLFEAAGSTWDITLTERKNHAKEIAQTLALSMYDAIVTVSGDGIVHELINGLLSRPDAAEITIPIGCIPGGSGNGISVSLTGNKYGYSASYSALGVIKGKSFKMDICSITQGENRYFSFISQTYGIVADCDLGTEHLRWMGDLRFTWGALKYILQGKRYSCQIAVKVEENDIQTIKESYRNSQQNSKAAVPSAKDTISGSIIDTYGSVNDSVPNDWTVYDEDIWMFWAGKIPYVARDMCCFPCASPNDGFLDLMIAFKKNVSRTKAIKFMGWMETGKHIDAEEENTSARIRRVRDTPQILGPLGSHALSQLTGSINSIVLLDELLLVAAKQDSEDIFEDILSQPNTYNINHADSIGNTALHYAAQFGSLTLVRRLLGQKNINVNSQNTILGDTPLHKAVQYTDVPADAYEIVEELLNAGANPRTRNKNGQRPNELVNPGNQDLTKLLQQAVAGLEADVSEIAQDDDSDDDEPPSDVSED
ncbi:9277_t:CDS:10 [Paraglomus brasilianum]|uniref:9277_t:CDS:1 n=1 Tax=Paraglomus brasilianum TaxID=144538 RepID=A0A9N8VN97_9GLOM|nr:9277_t:CDS:10 [Paraglomus brasilianum]